MRAALSRLGLAVATAAAALALPRPAPARAYEDQVGLAVGLGYAGIASDSTLPHHGPMLQLEAAFGLDDTWELRALASYAVEIGDEPLHRVTAGAEIVYLVDILEIVPFLGLGVDVPTSIWAHATSTEVHVDFAGHLVVGLDWLPSREWALGVEVRPHLMFTALATADPAWSAPLWITAILRAQYLFEI